jgi:GNAT superfamily N-acetyltransferase
VSFYRYLYNTVGAPWLWYERRRLDDSTLGTIIDDPKVEVHVLYVNGVPAGYAELDRCSGHEVEIAYFGLVPDFIGRGLGRYLLDWTLNEAWREEPRRVWVHTCNLDHPVALAFYQRAGFAPYKQETVLIDDPRSNETI